MRERLSGNEAVATAMRQINPDVMAAFPITPSTEIPQYFSKYVANGKVETEFVPVESEHSAMSACIGSQAAGARTTTATSSCGLALMWEELYIVSSCRLPITLAVVNRALSGPINIGADHSDSMGARDAGWIQIYSENNQEAYDNYIQAVKIAEHKDVLLPAMVCQDGFITSHAVENIELIEDDKVKAFVGEYTPEKFLLKKDLSMSMGPYDSSVYYMEHKRSQAEGMNNAAAVIQKVADDFEKLTGRKYGFIEEYKMDDAEYAIIAINSVTGTIKDVVDELRESGVKAGLIKIRVYRPFPAESIKNSVKGLKAVAVLDRSEGFSTHGGPVCAEVKAALYGEESQPNIINYIYGLGGRDVCAEDIQEVYEALYTLNNSQEKYRYLALRSEEK